MDCHLQAVGQPMNDSSAIQNKVGQYLQQLDACVRHFPLVTELQPHNELILALIGDNVLVLVVHLLCWSVRHTSKEGPFVPGARRVLSALPTESVARQ